MSISSFRNIGAFIKSIIGIDPANASAGTTNGAAIDRDGYNSCVLHGACGAATGSPTAQTVDQKLQDSADGSTGWADLTGAAITQLAADDAEAEVDVDLSSAKQFIRVVSVVAFTAGTSPAIPVASTVVLGGPVATPAT